MEDLKLHAIHVEQAKGKDGPGTGSYFWVRFKDPVVVGAYDGKQAMVWSSTAAKVIDEKGLGEVWVYRLEPSAKDPTWAPTIVAVIDLDGTVLYDKSTDPAEQKRRGSGGGGGGRPYVPSYRDTEEGFWAGQESLEARARAERASIENQTAVKSMAELAAACLPYDDPDQLFGRMAALVLEESRKLWTAQGEVRENGSAGARPTSRGATGGRGRSQGSKVQPASPAGPPSPGEADPSAGPAPADTKVDQAEKAKALTEAMAYFGRRSELEAAAGAKIEELTPEQIRAAIPTPKTTDEEAAGAA